MKFNQYQIQLLVPVGILLIGLFENVFADNVDVGKKEFESVCAVCHGLNGKGNDGPLKPLLVNPIPNLTLLAKKNDYLFPFDRIFQMIDGRKKGKSHGTWDMPAWGCSFNNHTSLYLENYPSYDSEQVTRSRIQALIGYLYRVQEW